MENIPKKTNFVFMGVELKYLNSYEFIACAINTSIFCLIFYLISSLLKIPFNMALFVVISFSLDVSEKMGTPKFSVPHFALAGIMSLVSITTYNLLF